MQAGCQSVFVSDTLLAVVIPAYKGKFLREALTSVAAQTYQRFKLYVCDDGSQEDLKSIFENSPRPIHASYIRFEENLGRRSPVKSWERAVKLSSEPWVWLFSDDDVMDKGCVAAFYQLLEEDAAPYNVYRFNTAIINSEGRVTRITPPHPARESANDFIYHRLAHQRFSFAPEYIFRRAAYEAHGGFVEFPYALGSDDASWITFAGEHAFLRGITGPYVFWRMSEINISSSTLKGGDFAGKLLGYLEYAFWLYQRLGNNFRFIVGGREAAFDTRDLVRSWYLNNLKECPCFFTPKECRTLIAAVSTRLDIPARKIRLILWQSNCRYLYSRKIKPLLEKTPPRIASDSRPSPHE